MTWNSKWDERCRVTEETQAYYRKMDNDEREFREFSENNRQDVEDELTTEEKFERVADAMIERAYQLTRSSCSTDQQMIYSAIYLACAVKFGMDGDTMRDALASFNEALDKSSAMDDLIEDETIKRWDQQA